MRVCRLKIENFRGIKSAEILFERHSVVVAPNNAGKTAIVEALALLLGRGRFYRELFEYDFFGADPSPEDRVRLSAVITDFGSNRPEDYPAFFNIERGASPAWWDPRFNSLGAEEGEGTTLALEIGFQARFDVEEMECESKRYFVDGDTDPFEEGSAAYRVPNSVIEAVGAFVVPARRDWDMLTSFRSRTFEQVVAATKAFPGTTVKAIRDELRNPKTKLERAPIFRDLVDRVDLELTFFAGRETAGLSFRATAGDTPAVLEALHPHLKGHGGVSIPIRHHGSGVRSLQTLLLLLEFGRLRQGEDRNFILIAEEPELHLHPGHHRRLVGRMRDVANQTIITTHSPSVASFHAPSEILITNPTGDGGLVSLPLVRSGSTAPQPNALKRLFTLYRQQLCEALMSPVVVIPEGATDASWIHHLSRSGLMAEGWDLQNVLEIPGSLGVVPTQSASVVATYEELIRVHQAIVPLVDGDGAGDDYCKELRRLGHPPALICQLKQGWTIEDVIAWVIGHEDQESVQGVLGSWDGSQQSLAKAIRSEAVKTDWPKHEEIAALILERKASLMRVRSFLAGLWAAGTRDTPPVEWKPDTTQPGRWRFSP
jgi:putative ATP-dependent endonuclease of OLD family